MTSKSNDARLAPLLFDVESRLDDSVDLTAMAQKFGASRFHFHRLFHNSTGETPRDYIERLRLERALLRIALTSESIRDVGLSAGFPTHETFSRAFKRRFGLQPSQWRKQSQVKQVENGQGVPPTTSDQCQLSPIRIESLPSCVLLAKRRTGDYGKFDYVPFADSDRLWNPLARWATNHKVPYSTPAWGFTHDIPGLTPPDAQRFDGCIRVDREMPDSREIHCMSFAGGLYFAVDHVGPHGTLPMAYSALVYKMNRTADRYAWRAGPSLTIYQACNVDGDASRHHTTVCFPVTKLQQRKKRQSKLKSHR